MASSSCQGLAAVLKPAELLVRSFLIYREQSNLEYSHLVFVSYTKVK